METKAPLRPAEEARAAAMVYEACAEVLLNLPRADIVHDIGRSAALLGSNAFADVVADEHLEQRFYDRLFVATSHWFVPLGESCIRGMHHDGTVRRFGPTADSRTDHVGACYRAAGFDFTALQGLDLAVRSLRPDSLAAELAFMAYLSHREAAAPDAGTAEQCRQLGLTFLDQHLACWVGAAAQALAEPGDDFYARAVAFATAWVELDRQPA